MAARRIPAVVALIALLFLAAAARAQKDAETSLVSANLLILPFENLGKDARLDWIGEGLAELSAERITGDGRLVFPREEWLAALERMGLPASGHFSRATMIKIGEEVIVDRDEDLFRAARFLVLSYRKLTLFPRGGSHPAP